MPASKELIQYYMGQPVKFVYLSLDDKYSNWVQAVKEEELTSYPDNFLFTHPKQAELLNQLQVRTIPRYLIFDQEGTLLNSQAPGPNSPELRTIIDELLYHGNQTSIGIIDSLQSPYKVYVRSVDSMFKDVEHFDELNKLHMEKSSELHQIFGRDMPSIKAGKRVTDLYVQRYMELLNATPASTLKESQIAFLQIFTNGLGYVTLEDLKSFLMELPPQLKGSTAAKTAEAHFSRLDNFPEFDASAIDGDILEDMEGQTSVFGNILETSKTEYKIVFFGASWCAACRHAEHWFSEWHPQIKEELVMAINVSIDKDRIAWKKSVVDDAFAWKSYLLKEGDQAGLYTKLTLGKGIPVILLLNKENRILHASTDIREIMKQLPTVRFTTII